MKPLFPLFPAIIAVLMVMGALICAHYLFVGKGDPIFLFWATIAFTVIAVLVTFVAARIGSDRASTPPSRK